MGKVALKSSSGAVEREIQRRLGVKPKVTPGQLPERTLREFRLESGLSQKEIAAAMGVTQSAVSKLERKPLSSIDNLQNYLNQLDGRLQLVVLIGDERFELDVE